MIDSLSFSKRKTVAAQTTCSMMSKSSFIPKSPQIPSVSNSEKIVDSFEGVTVTWKYHSHQQNQRRASSVDNQEKIYMELIFDKSYKDIVISSYLPFIIKKAQEIKNQSKAVQIHSLKSYYIGHKEGVNLDHPSIFETLAMDQKSKKEIMDALDLFLKRKEFYKKRSKKRGRGGIYCTVHPGPGNRV